MPSNTREFGNTWRRINQNAIGGNQLPVLARVLKQYHDKDQYWIDAEVLNADKETDANWEPLQQIEAPQLFWAGADTGVWVEILEQSLVRIGFYDGDQHRPYLDAVLGTGSAPSTAGVTLWIKAVGASVKLTPGAATIAAGTVTDTAAQTDQAGNVRAMPKVIECIVLAANKILAINDSSHAGRRVFLTRCRCHLPRR